jgi:hypothetical protein
MMICCLVDALSLVWNSSFWCKITKYPQPPEQEQQHSSPAHLLTPYVPLPVVRVLVCTPNQKICTAAMLKLCGRKTSEDNKQTDWYAGNIPS